MKKKKTFFWIIGGGLLQIPLIKEVKALGYNTIVSDVNPKCVCADIADIFLLADIFDIQKHIKEAFKLKVDGIKIAGVLAAGIDATVTMAVLAKVLGLPSVDPVAAHITNNKNIFREVMQTLGYPVPRFKTISDVAETGEAIKEVGFPLIVKNTDSSGSRGVKIFRNGSLAAIKTAVKNAMDVSRSKLALIEEFWEGEEFTVETIFDIDGKFHRCFITDRIFDRSGHYALELGLRNPSTLPKSIQKEMYHLTKRVAQDIGIKIGAAKIDMILTKNGIRIIEMTTRLSGGFDCQYLVPAATGKNVLKAAILTAAGKRFSHKQLLENKKNAVGLTASIWPQKGNIKSIKGVTKARNIPGIEHIFLRHKKGDVVDLYTDCTKRVCFVIATGSNEQGARCALDKALKTIKIETV
ncbi:MAG: ATP-grasp domain-containing protein [Planctomycetes bacterium]|nr:ATP-grasp domain-containing protein [Planctomycetota bacterium]